jgi:hypothetical protein
MALEGRKIFRRAGCGDCHSGVDFTDSANGVLHDVGTLLPTSGSRLFGKLEGIDTPSLKGAWHSAPYYHDGRAATLMEIFTKYNPEDKMGVTSNLSTTELEQLVEYLLELDDVPEPPTAVTPTPASRGFCSIEPATTQGSGPAPSSHPTTWAMLTAAALAVCLARRRN